MFLWMLLFIGINFVYQGATAEYFVDESEGNASDEEKERWKATPFLRGAFIALGLAVSTYSIIHIVGNMRSHASN